MSSPYQAALVEELKKLVRIPSSSFPEGGEEGKVQAFVAGRMKEMGARVRTFEADDVPGVRSHPLFCGRDRQFANRPTVLGEIGPQNGAALLVLAHSDTVQLFEPEGWTVDPFACVLRDGELIGLGVSDDKWGVASMLSIMRELLDRGEPLRKRVIFASTIDEENGVGNGVLLLWLAGVNAQSAFYLDGGNMDICIGNCGGSNLYLRPKASIAPHLLERHGNALQDVALQMSAARAHLFDSHALYRINSRRTCSVGYVMRADRNGPYHVLYFYTLLGEPRAKFCAELELAVANALAEDLVLYNQNYREPWFEASCGDPAEPFTQMVCEAYRRVTATEPRIATLSKQDAFVLRNHGRIPIVSFGVGRYSGKGAVHTPDEAVTLESVWVGRSVAFEAIHMWLNAN